MYCTIVFSRVAVQFLNVMSVAIVLLQMNKAGVLRKAIEVILKLQNDNARLKQENMALKMAQQKRGIGVMHELSNLCTVFSF